MRILPISGNLWLVSSTTAPLRAATRLVRKGIEIKVYDGLGDLPHFHPYLEGIEPGSVVGFRSQHQASDGVLIAHGVAGLLKNALDWLVGNGELVIEPVALLNAAPCSTCAQVTLVKTIRTMSARIGTEAPITVPLPGRKLTEDGMVDDAETLRLLKTAKSMTMKRSGYEMVFEAGKGRWH